MRDRPPRVLVLEDDDAIRTALALALLDEGYSVRQAADADEALAVLAAWLPDLILLDIELPGSDGWVFRRAQRALPGAAGVPVVVVSASHRLIAPSGELAPAAVFTKPFRLDELLRTVDRITSRPTMASAGGRRSSQALARRPAGGASEAVGGAARD
jgi:DNA-binding response OmpR family regulator